MRRSLVAATALVLVLPHTAWACAVCFDATDENRQAFLDATILMTALPLLLVGAGGYWVYRQFSASVA